MDFSWERLVIHPDFKTTSFDVVAISVLRFERFVDLAVDEEAFCREVITAPEEEDDVFLPDDGVIVVRGSFKAVAADEFFPIPLLYFYASSKTSIRKFLR